MATNIITPVIINVADKNVEIGEGPIGQSLVPQVLAELTERWQHLTGHRETNMHADKVHRAENLRVENGKVLFDIERHASTMNGSTRAAVHTWSVDLTVGSAVIANETFRQVKPAAKAYTKADARKNAQSVLSILTGRRKNRGELKSCGENRYVVHASSFADLGQFKATVISRRKQFINALETVLPSRGWLVSGDEKTPAIEIFKA